MGRKTGGATTVRVTVSESTTINQGQFCLLNGFFGRAVQAAATGENQTTEIVLDIEQAEYETSQVTTDDDFNKGDEVYWNDTTKLLTTQANANAGGIPQNRVVGRVTDGKDANNVIWFILGPQV